MTFLFVTVISYKVICFYTVDLIEIRLDSDFDSIYFRLGLNINHKNINTLSTVFFVCLLVFFSKTGHGFSSKQKV